MSLSGSPGRVLIVGSGGREHALAWRLAAEPGVEQVVVAPGNPLMEDVARTVPGIGPSDHRRILDICRSLNVALVVIGPEAPLVAGLADALGSAGITCLGPSAAAARLEGSKSFCREVADAAGVPMADGAAFDDPEAAFDYAARLGAPLVVKADGLAAGKGVSVCDSLADAQRAIADAMIGGRFGSAGRRVVVERRLEGREASVICLSDGTDALLLPVARDHKRLSEGDSGPNTGGMGACSPVGDLSATQVRDVVDRFHMPLLAEMRRRGAPFRGFLYAGLMLTVDGPRLLEVNVRLGDPEAQVVLPLIDVPLGTLMVAAAQGRLAQAAAQLGLGDALPSSGCAVGVTLAAAGYPDGPRTGDRIDGIDAAQATGALVFGAGVERDAAGDLRTAGGRVLTVVGPGPDLAAARKTAYSAAEAVHFAGRQLRRDIGAAAARGLAASSGVASA
ncbi:MAG TPA: phosphoribosylamine--glycine ligase [Candidatus Limnocylindrales bacterium]|nr:phosphoribosylamine--glycine ligase [Candidatus Limnocylindrales bacterium]